MIHYHPSHDGDYSQTKILNGLHAVSEGRGGGRGGERRKGGGEVGYRGGAGRERKGGGGEKTSREGERGGRKMEKKGRVDDS